MSEEDDGKINKEKTLDSTTETKGETYLYRSQRSIVCPNCNFQNHSEADVCARCKIIL
ncbi:MAG: hypothetical protein ACJ70Z_09950 [Nitrososphaera sp.]